MIDDLITCGTREPYRMFTSRAEYRLLLREDNADLRLTEKGRELGLVDDERWQVFEHKRNEIGKLQNGLKKQWVRVDSEQALKVEEIWGKKLQKEASLMDLLRRPEVDVETLLTFAEEENVAPEVAEQVAIQVKYAGYIERQQTEINRASRYDHYPLAIGFDYSSVPGMSNEVKEKLQKHRPETLGQAGRIPGMTPAAVSLLLVYLKNKNG
jgi:tRNA uridine 5-carboxymethylaminomethyl modification enzyme